MTLWPWSFERTDEKYVRRTGFRRNQSVNKRAIVANMSLHVLLELLSKHGTKWVPSLAPRSVRVMTVHRRPLRPSQAAPMCKWHHEKIMVAVYTSSRRLKLNLGVFWKACTTVHYITMYQEYIVAAGSFLNWLYHTDIIYKECVFSKQVPNLDLSLLGRALPFPCLTSFQEGSSGLPKGMRTLAVQQRDLKDANCGEEMCDVRCL